MPIAVAKSLEAKKLVEKEKTKTYINNSDSEDQDVGNLVIPDGYTEEEDLLNMEIPPFLAPLSDENETNDRLFISEIEVDNFKSYLGKQKIGPFHDKFTAIIGPNGSGKSNVIDSLLFVFGYRASKIRSKKISVLIHSSAGHENISSCTVTIFFKQINKIEINNQQIFKKNEISVSRTAYRNNSSQYMLNGKQTSFKEIADFLRKSKIDLVHNRFLILQGEVEHISLMKPKAQNENEEGMLEYLEDIIGSNRLKLPINKLNFKLSQLQEQLMLQHQRLERAEKEELSLKKSAKTAYLMLIIENLITLSNAKISFIQKLALSKEMTKFTLEHEDFLIELDEAQKENNKLLLNLKEIKENQKNLHKILEKKQEAETKAKADFSEKKQIIEKISNDKKRLQNQLKKFENDIQKELITIAELENLPEKAGKKIIKLKEELIDVEKKIKINSLEVEKKLPLVKEKTEKYRDSHKQLDAELSKYVLLEDEIAGKLGLAQEELSNLQREETNERRIYADMCDRLSRIEEDCKTKLQNLKVAEESIPKSEKALKDLKLEENNLKEEVLKQSSTIKTLRIELEDYRQLTEKNHGASCLLQALMNQKKNGRIKGLFGRLGDLGAIDEKYDIAISTTCSALDNIVVDCVETAQLCIKFLQTENLGTATFIALDKQKHFLSKMQNKPTTPENAPRLFDLIRVVDDKVLPAFYYALGDTLVADDIAAATRISMSGQQRWRTVTLKGEVVETSGAMTGGGNIQKSGKIGQNVKVNTNTQTKDFKSLHLELEKAEEKLNNLNSSLNQVQKNYRESETNLTRTKIFVKNLKTDTDMLQKNIDELKEQIVQQNQKIKKVSVDPVILEQNKLKINKFQEELNKLTKTTDEIRMKLIDLTEKIDNINDEIVGNYQKALREAENQKNTIEKSISKENNAISSNERNLKKASLRKNDLEGDLEQIKVNLKELETLHSEANDELCHLKFVIEQSRAEVVEAEKSYNELMEQSKQKNADELGIEKRIMHLREKIDSVQKKMDQNKRELKKIETEINEIKLFQLKYFPDYLINNDNGDSFLKSFFSDVTWIQGEFDEMMEILSTNVDVEEDLDNTKENLDISISLAYNSKHTYKIKRCVKLPFFLEEKILNFDFEKIKKNLQNLEERKTSLKKDNVKIRILIEYLEKLDVLDTESQKYKNIVTQRNNHRNLRNCLKKQRFHEFMEGFHIIGERLKEMYQMITLGGDASLDLVDSLDPFTEGIFFRVRPPKKSWKQIINLSGGEKTLASLALVFSLHHYRPTPFYVMDEIDAALDYRNVSILSYLIKEKTKNAQFIIISLRNNMFEKCDRLIGIYKNNDCTKNVVLDYDLEK